MNGWTIKKEIFLHLFPTVAFVLLFVLLKLLDLPSLILPFVVGTVIGMVLPDIDHLIYALYLHPSDLSSQRIKVKLTNKQFVEVFKLLYTTRDERRDLIFHNLFFVGIFCLFAFFVISSSGSLLGRGLVISFLLHLLMDEYRDIKILKGTNSWFKYLAFQQLETKIDMVLGAQLVFLLLISFIF